MTEFDLTDREARTISSCLLYCSAKLTLDDDLAKDFKQKNITVHDIIQLEEKISTQKLKFILFLNSFDSTMM